MKRSNWFTILFRVMAVCIAGIIGAFGMAPGFHWYALLIGLSVFYVFYAGTQTGRMAALLAFFFSLGYFTHGLFWIGNALLVEGNSFRWVWPISVIGLPVLLSLFYALFVGLGRKFSDPLKLGGFLMLAACMALAEWTRGHIFSGFPWNMASHTWIAHLSVLQFVSIGGATLLSLLTFLWFLFPGWLTVSKSPVSLKAISTILIIAVFLGCYVFGNTRLIQHPTDYNQDITIRVVQPNIAQELKWKPELIADHFNTLISLSNPYKNAPDKDTHQTFIIWPETAIPPQILESGAAGNIIQNTLSSFPHNASLITGALRKTYGEDDQTFYHNSLVALDSDYAGLALYDKSHLVPFGEYIPFQQWIPIKPVVEFSGFAPGDGPQTLPLSESFSITPLICYEIIFPGMARGGNERADLIVNITNDGWYGVSAGPHQHFSQAVIRAVEQGVPVARAANTGISGIIDAYGRILTETNLNQKTALSLPLPEKSTAPTIYRKFGDFSFFTCICMLFLVTFLTRNP